jgi:hypothetical protein
MRVVVILAAFGAVVAANATMACKNVGEGKVEVDKPVVGIKKDTINVPTIEVSTKKDTVTTPTVTTKKTEVSVPKVKVHTP